MSEAAAKALSLFQGVVGKPDAPSEWLEVDQDRINLFADATLDHQFIHIDPVKSAELSPYKVTIAHGFLTLSSCPSSPPRFRRRCPRLMKGLLWGELRPG